MQTMACTPEMSRTVLRQMSGSPESKEPTLRILQVGTPARLVEITEGPFQKLVQKGEIIAEEIP